MSTRTHTGTKNAIYYVENEAIRGLIVIVSTVGLSLSSLLSSKENLVKSMLFYLEENTLKVLQLTFYDRNGSSISNGYGIWNFHVRYNAFGIGAIELPVNRVVDEIHNNKWAFVNASSYEVTLWVKAGARAFADSFRGTSQTAYSVAELSLDWGTGKQAGTSSSTSTYVGSFGYNPINVSIYRQR